jgi:hypothetical protein
VLSCPPGACVSPESKDNEDARLWFNCVEEMVFTDDVLCSDTLLADVDDHPVTCSIAASRRKLQALQAAYIVCLYQNWEGIDSSKRRIRRYRFGTVVSVGISIPQYTPMLVPLTRRTRKGCARHRNLDGKARKLL